MNFEQAKDYYKKGLIAYFNANIVQEPIEKKGYIHQAISMFELSVVHGYKKGGEAVHKMQLMLREFK